MLDVVAIDDVNDIDGVEADCCRPVENFGNVKVGKVKDNDVEEKNNDVPEQVENGTSSTINVAFTYLPTLLMVPM